MARGFESKAVADQQESAQAGVRPGPSDEVDPAVALKRRRLELAHTDVLHQLQMARAEAHREMLRQALAALGRELSQLGY